MIAPTWEQHCAEYTPGRYTRETTDPAVERDAEVLSRILAGALRRQRFEETSAGSCYRSAA